MKRIAGLQEGLSTLCFAICACSFPAPPGEGSAIDARPDSNLPGSWSADVDFLRADEEVFVDVDWTIDANTLLDTRELSSAPALPAGVTFSVGLQDSGDEVAILRVRTLKLNDGRILSVQGTRSFLVLANDEIVLEGLLDVGGHLNVAGPGGGSGGAGNGAGKPSVHGVGGSGYDDPGAGGGSFATAGAAGGKVGTVGGGAAGELFALADRLIGGGSGGAAGLCTNRPGGGGGAVLLYAKQRIRLLGGGAINAGGGGGEGGIAAGCSTGAGPGAGGGAGGTIWLQTPSLEGDGLVAANGGGGGGGSYVNVSNGGNGGDGLPSVTAVAMGGAKAGNVETTAGGNGAIAGTAASAIPELPRGNGGGGGGGLGTIVARAKEVSTTLQASPAITPAP